MNVHSSSTRRRQPSRAGLLIALILTLSLGCNAITGIPTHRLDTPIPPFTATMNQVLHPSALPSSTRSPVSFTHRLVGYYASWSLYDPGYPASIIPADKLTHINYAFAVISENGECISSNQSNDQENFPALRELKRQYPHLKTLISIGGWGQSKGFSPAAQADKTRLRLALSCIRFMKENNFDGIDIDWEYPSPEERSNFTALLAVFRRQLEVQGAADNNRYLLTIAVGASPYQYNDIDLAQITPYLDWINLMTYDFHGPWSGLTGFNAPLYPSTRDLAASQVERANFNVQAAVQAFLTAGVPADKIVVGVPFFGRGWAGVPDNNHGLYQTFNGTPNGQSSTNYLDLKNTYLIEGSGYTRYWEDEAMVPWIYNPLTGIMISYDDPQSLSLKADYIKAMNLGGIMIWQLGADDEQGSLLDALYSHLKD